MNLWITGADGLLGKTLRPKTTLATTRKEADITQLESLREIAKANLHITHIVNCAAQSLVDGAENDKMGALQANAIGPENLAIIAKEMGAHFTHISTDYVFSGEKKIPWKETDPTEPCNYYGITKLEGELRVQKILPDACILRTSWIFGQGGKNFVAKLLKLFQENETVQLTNDQWGRPTYAPDLSEIIIQLLGKSGIYQFANSGATTKYEFGLAMQEEAINLGLPLKVKEIIPVSSQAFPSLVKRPQFSVFNTTKIEQELHLSIRPWRDALREFLCNVDVPSLLSL